MGRSSGRPTLQAVADRAGVGRGTVSRVINGAPGVSPATRRVVQRAIDELNYVPNRAARALVTRRTDAVALVVSEISEKLFGEPFFASIVRGINQAFLETPLQVWLAVALSPAERDRIAHYLTDQHIDGVLLLSMHDADPMPDLLRRRGLPMVLGGRTPRMLRSGAGPAYCVDVDNAGGARLAVEHLVATGRRRIATIAGSQDMGVGITRLAGYRHALAVAARMPELVAYGDFGEASGMAAMRQLLAVAPDLDAVFAASDLMAIGAVRALREAGRRVPEDVAVVGFEDAPVAAQCDPPLTTIHQPVGEMGRQMVRLLLPQIGGARPEPALVLLDTHLVPRSST